MKQKRLYDIYRTEIYEGFEVTTVNNVFLGTTQAVSTAQAVNNYCFRTKTQRYNTDGYHWGWRITAKLREENEE